MRGDSTSAVQWVLNCKHDVRAGKTMRLHGSLEVKENWWFQAKNLAGVESTLGGLITRCEQ